MENNKHLNKILRLILAYYYEGKINHDDLYEIKDFVGNIKFTGIEKNLTFTNHSKSFYIPSNISEIIPIGEALKYVMKFTANFDAKSSLNKIFSIKSTLLFRSLDYGKDVALRLISYEGSYEIAHLVDGKAFLIDCANNSTKEINEEECKIAFEEKIGKELDKELDEISLGQKLNNTRVITIPYKSNFDKFLPDDKKYVNLIPSVVDKDGIHQHQFTFLMYFDEEPDLNSNPTIKSTKVYYDTFQLCPPRTC